MAPLPPLVIVDPYAWERSMVTRLALNELVAVGQLAANEEGRPAEAGSSLASRLRALGRHVTGRMRRALHLGV
jgi:hypothetical protein